MVSNKFWFGFTAFFVFVFPLFFIYTGHFLSSPIFATISLVIGTILWFIFIIRTYIQTIVVPLKQQHEMRSVINEGQLRQGTVERKILRKKLKDDQQLVDIIVGFENLSGTYVKQNLEFIDTKPHQQRYEEGRHLNLRLSKTGRSPGILLADTKVYFSWKSGFLACSFLIIYMIGTFFFSLLPIQQRTWLRFLALWHPWVLTPFLGLLLFNLKNVVGIFLSGDAKIEEKLTLWGKKVMAEVQSVEETGISFNDQPQVKYTLEFVDEKGKTHVVSIRHMVPLTELHQLGAKTKEILYLPEDPQCITFC